MLVNKMLNFQIHCVLVCSAKAPHKFCFSKKHYTLDLMCNDFVKVNDALNHWGLGFFSYRCHLVNRSSSPSKAKILRIKSVLHKTIPCRSNGAQKSTSGPSCSKHR